MGEATSWKRRGQRAGLCLLTGLCIWLSLPFSASPDSNLWPLAWVALTPLLWALRGLTPGAAFRYGWLAGWLGAVGLLLWLPDTLQIFAKFSGPLSWALLLGLAAYRGLQLAVFSGLYALLRERKGSEPHILVVAALFVLIESVWPLIFPAPLGATQFRTLPVIQVVDLTGVAGVSFALVVFSVALFHALSAWREGTRPSRATLGIGLGVPLAVVAYGLIRMSGLESAMAEATSVRVGVVEPDIGIFSKEAKHLPPEAQERTLRQNLLKQQLLSAKLEAEGAELVVWPEATFVPPGEVYAKKSAHFALGVTAEGQLAFWDEQQGSFSWRTRMETGSGRLRAVHAAREDVACAVGEVGASVCWDGQGVAPLPTETTASLNGVAVLATDRAHTFLPGAPVEVWAAGEGGALLKGSPAGVTPIDSGTTRDLNAIAMAKPGQGAAVGDGGVVVTIARGEVAATTTLVDRDLYAVWVAPDARGAWIGGEGGAIYQLGRGGWRRTRTDTSSAIRAFAGASTREVFAVGDAGAVLRQRVGTSRWEALDPPADVDLRAASVDARGTLMVAATDGRVWSREGAAWTERAAPPGRGLVAMTWLPYSRYEMPLPRDLRYLSQSRAPLPPTPTVERDPAVFSWDRNVVQRGFEVPTIFGAMTRPGGVDGYNTALVVDRVGRIASSVDKVELLLVAETMPSELAYAAGPDGVYDVSSGLYEIFPEATNLAAAEEPGVLTLDLGPKGELRAGVMICYEDILPGHNRALSALSPNLLVNLTNDAWFGVTGEPYQHLALATLRAIEVRRAMVRATQTGVSAVIAPTGEILDHTSLIEGPESLVADLPLLEAGTLYAATGPLFVWLCLAGVLVAFWRSRRSRAA